MVATGSIIGGYLLTADVIIQYRGDSARSMIDDHVVQASHCIKQLREVGRLLDLEGWLHCLQRGCRELRSQREQAA